MFLLFERLSISQSFTKPCAILQLILRGSYSLKCPYTVNESPKYISAQVFGFSFKYTEYLFTSLHIRCPFSGEKACVRENDGEFDFKRPKLLREALDNVSGNGYDHTFLKCHKSNYCAR